MANVSSPYDCSILPITNKNDNSNLEKLRFMIRLKII